METYNPLLGCETCNKLTRHYFVRRQRRKFECNEDHAVLTPSDKKVLLAEGKFNLLMYKCIGCGTERGWGNEAVEDDAADTVKGA